MAESEFEDKKPHSRAWVLHYANSQCKALCQKIECTLFSSYPLQPEPKKGGGWGETEQVAAITTARKVITAGSAISSLPS